MFTTHQKYLNKCYAIPSLYTLFFFVYRLAIAAIDDTPNTHFQMCLHIHIKYLVFFSHHNDTNIRLLMIKKKLNCI